MPPHRKWWGLARRIRRMAVSGHATFGRADLGSAPKSAKYVPNNCCICTGEGPGDVALGGGDYDGGLSVFSANKHLLNFLKCTQDGDGQPEVQAAREFVEGYTEKSAPAPLESMVGYRDYCMRVRTPSGRGILTAMAEIGQEKVFKSLNPLADGWLIRAVRLAVAAEKAYDAPKKTDARKIIALGQALLRDAGLTFNSPRSTRCIAVAKIFRLDAARLDPAAVLLGVNLRLGLVWMPSPQIVLSSDAGAALRPRLLSHRRRSREEGLGQAVFKVPLDEVAGALAHRLVGRDADFPTLVREGSVDQLIALAEELAQRRKRCISKPDHLERTPLPWATSIFHTHFIRTVYHMQYSFLFEWNLLKNNICNSLI